MYQFEFFDKKSYQSKLKALPNPPENFIGIEDIELMRSSYWAEHCLECGEPLCYSTCEHYAPRADGRCKRFEFGIFDNPVFGQFPHHAEISFRKWGKLESIVYPGVMKPEEALAIDSDWATRRKGKRRLMSLGALGRRLYPIEARQQFGSDKYQFSDSVGKADMMATPMFLLQLFSLEDGAFTLFLEITDDADLVFREGVRVAPGYNQVVLDAASVFPGKGKLRVKIYPEANAEVRIVLLFCNFVKLREPTSQQGPDLVQAESKPAVKVKCVAWDLDNTVWNGILMENDPDLLELRPGVVEAMRWLDERGVIQIVASKNSDSDVLPVLDRLGVSQYFVARFVNWNPKSANLAEAAALLNINIDTFALVDDSPFERAEVLENLPMVRVYPETVVGADGGGFSSLPEFDVVITAESGKRRQMYQAEMERKTQSAASSASPIEFLKSCKLEGRIGPLIDEPSKLRGYELLQRTNQLNLSGHRYDKGEFFERVANGPDRCLTMFCSDRFGDYGQVLYLEKTLDDDTETLVIDEYALSCRVARKGVEAALAKWLLRECAADGVKAIELHGVKTERNGLLVESFCLAGFEDMSVGNDIVLRLEDETRLVNPDIVTIIR